MATMKDLDRLALALPHVTKEVSEDGRPSYVVHGKSSFCFHRSPRHDAVDPETGERLTDVLVFRVDGLDVKELMLSDERGIFFSTPHWNGYAAVLMRIKDLKRLDDVLVFRVDGLDLKELMVSDTRGIFFTTPHWNGYPAVLVRIRDLKRVGKQELGDLVAEAWLTKGQKRVAKAWLAEQGVDQ